MNDVIALLPVYDMYNILTNVEENVNQFLALSYVREFYSQDRF